ncbi:LysR family transcriptional regulator, partial [Mesorhizobium sp. M7D.F.Ca.US.004.01.2.1]|uniref:LysR family transcriptional regulator n=1 Tax=Mesorhizobium sp. M7D.F.Ca.US.004.01.2.1 TaxID=2496738 RepID=UPI000FD1C32B
MVNMRQIEIFRMVMETGTTVGAARSLNISQPAVSDRIKHLESQIGFELFKRDKGKLIPTKEASVLYSEVEGMFFLFRLIQQKIVELKEATSGTLRIASTPSVGNTIVAESISSFLSGHPEVRISLDISKTEEVNDQVFHGLCDFGIHTMAMDRPGLQFKPTRLAEMVCAVPIGHSLESQDKIEPSDLAKHGFVTLAKESPAGRLIAHAFASANVEYVWSIEATYANTACAIAKNIGAVAIVDQFTGASLNRKDFKIVR